jgi:8-oxo-dGTP pyrophosphatase MutT (NUDIX family)
MNEKKFHRHLGVYGICRNGTKLLTVQKTRGPYRNRYDLPGGSIEVNESLELISLAM